MVDTGISLSRAGPKGPPQRGEGRAFPAESDGGAGNTPSRRGSKGFIPASTPRSIPAAKPRYGNAFSQNENCGRFEIMGADPESALAVKEAVTMHKMSRHGYINALSASGERAGVRGFQVNLYLLIHAIPDMSAVGETWRTRARRWGVGVNIHMLPAMQPPTLRLIPIPERSL